MATANDPGDGHRSRPGRLRRPRDALGRTERHVCARRGDSPLGDQFNRALFYLFQAFDGPYHIDDDLTVAPLALAAEEEGDRLLREHVGLGSEKVGEP